MYHDVDLFTVAKVEVGPVDHTLVCQLRDSRRLQNLGKKWPKIPVSSPIVGTLSLTKNKNKYFNVVVIREILV